MLLVFIKGFGMGLALLAPIGPQNVFVINQAMKREYYWIIPIICCLCDLILISLGVLGLGVFFKKYELLFLISKIGGSIFIIRYGIISLLSIFRNNDSKNEEKRIKSIREAIVATLAITLLNPGVYFDTVVLIGSASIQFEEYYRYLFGLGALSASFLWFFSISIGGKVISPIFKNRKFSKIIDVTIAVFMIYLGISLVYH